MFQTSLFCQKSRILRFIKPLGIATLSISQILKTTDSSEVVNVKGWIKSLRNQKQNVFIDLNDGSSSKKLQIFVPKAVIPQGLNPGASISVSGPLGRSPKGQIELKADSVEITGKCVITDGYPFVPRQQYEAEYVRKYLHFRPRTNKFSSVLRVRNAATLAIYNHFNSEGFVNVHTPILTSNDCEGAGEVFKVIPENTKLLKTMAKPGQGEDEVYFNRKALLSVSGQLHLEAVAHGLSKVYAFGPTFRAENSRSRLHLSEFYMLEAEIAFVEHLEQIINSIEKLLKSVTTAVLATSSEDVARCQGEKLDALAWINKKFPIMTYEEALTILNANKDQYTEKLTPDAGLAKEHELFLVKYCGDVPVFIISWPKEMKPFYMKEGADGKVAALDLLAPITGELVGGSLREDNYEVLKAKIPQNNSHLNWYLELRKFGSVPTGGYGLGFERYLQLILGITNIKDTIPFPRWPHNCNL